MFAIIVTKLINFCISSDKEYQIWSIFWISKDPSFFVLTSMSFFILFFLQKWYNVLKYARAFSSYKLDDQGIFSSYKDDQAGEFTGEFTWRPGHFFFFMFIILFFWQRWSSPLESLRESSLEDLVTIHHVQSAVNRCCADKKNKNAGEANSQRKC